VKADGKDFKSMGPLPLRAMELTSPKQRPRLRNMGKGILINKLSLDYIYRFSYTLKNAGLF